MIDKPTLNIVEVAGELGVHVNTVKRMPYALLPFFTVSSRGDRRYRRTAVEAFIARQLAAAKAEQERGS